jgi:23S rRNA (cytidine1920-2'-O)/16S rRNA (cytidine1409-2'-O)-methyltransferase
VKIRLDELLLKRKVAANLKEAQALIGAGTVLINDVVSDKVGNLYDSEAQIRIKSKSRYVSRGGLKLEKALVYFKMNINGLFCIDIGASTGGFTDCLLQHGARRVYAVDVAYGQLAWKLRKDDRVVVLERYNARELTTAIIPEKLDLAVIDASFISLKTLLPPLLPLLSATKTIVALIKPQFEVPKENVGEGGVVRSAEDHQEVIEDISAFGATLQLSVNGVVQSPILGPKGNKEFLIYFSSTD